MKRGPGTCGRFQSCKLMYLHVLRAGMVCIALWYMHVPKYVLGQNYPSCMYQRTNVPLSSARLPTSFQQPQHIPQKISPTYPKCGYGHTCTIMKYTNNYAQNPSLDSSIDSASAWNSGGPGFKSRHGREFFN